MSSAEFSAKEDIDMGMQGVQYSALGNFLLTTFEDASSLADAVMRVLSQRLNVIVGPGSLSKQVYDLVRWLDCKGWVDRFVIGLRSQQLGSPEAWEELIRHFPEKQRMWNVSTSVSDSASTISGSTMRQVLSEGLLKAFPSYGDFERLFSFGLNVRLATVVDRGALTQVVEKILEWAESNDRLDELVREARRSNPGNQTLAQAERIYDQYRSQPSPSDVSRHLSTATVTTGDPWVAAVVSVVKGPLAEWVQSNIRPHRLEDIGLVGAPQAQAAALVKWCREHGLMDVLNEKLVLSDPSLRGRLSLR